MNLDGFGLVFYTIVCFALTYLCSVYLLAEDKETREEFSPGMVYQPFFGLGAIAFSGLTARHFFGWPMAAGSLVGVLLLVGAPMAYLLWRRKRRQLG